MGILHLVEPKPKEPLRSSVERSTDKNIKPPIMPVDKPYLTNIDVNNFNLSWLPAILPPKSKPTPILWVYIPAAIYVNYVKDFLKFYYY